MADTPIMKTKKWAVERTRTIQSLADFIKKFLKLMASEQLVGAGTWRPGLACPGVWWGWPGASRAGGLCSPGAQAVTPCRETVLNLDCGF